MQRLHAAPAYLCGSQRAELFGWLVSWHPKRPQQSRATHAGKRQAAPLHAAVRKKVFGESHPVRPCRRYGAGDCFHLAKDRDRNEAAEHSNRSGAMGDADARIMNPTSTVDS